MTNVPSNDDTSLDGNSTSKPASKDRMSSPLSWCLERVGASVLNDQWAKATVEKVENSAPVLIQFSASYTIGFLGNYLSVCPHLKSLPYLCKCHCTW